LHLDGGGKSSGEPRHVKAARRGHEKNSKFGDGHSTGVFRIPQKSKRWGGRHKDRKAKSSSTCGTYGRKCPRLEMKI